MKSYEILTITCIIQCCRFTINAFEIHFYLHLKVVNTTIHTYFQANLVVSLKLCNQYCSLVAECVESNILASSYLGIEITAFIIFWCKTAIVLCTNITPNDCFPCDIPLTSVLWRERKNDLQLQSFFVFVQNEMMSTDCTLM